MIGCVDNHKSLREQEARAELNKFHPQKAILFRQTGHCFIYCKKPTQGVKKWRERGINNKIKAPGVGAEANLIKWR